MEKTYTLRGSGSRRLKQTALPFQCRRSARVRGKRPQDEGKADENDASPPKRGKTNEVTSAPNNNPPSTPTKSPLKETNQTHPPSHVTSPQTPDHHVTHQPSPHGTPSCRTPSLSRGRKQLQFSPSLTPVQKTKQAFHGGHPYTLLCREKQQQSIREFVEGRERERQGGTLYISGAPGTGKTACVSHLLREMKHTLSQVQVLFINCMSITIPHALYGRLATELLGEKGGAGGKEGVKKRIMSHMKSAENMILLVLDELDQLVCRDQDVLYSLFEWSSLPDSRLILIGIANSLDLTDRILPRLVTHTQCRPRLLHFPPYSREEIVAILEERMGRSEGVFGEGVNSEGVGGEVVLERNAIEFCARKVSAVHGDLRKALDICRRAIELAEFQSPASHPHHNTPSHPPSTPSRPHHTPSQRHHFRISLPTHTPSNPHTSHPPHTPSRSHRTPSQINNSSTSHPPHTPPSHPHHTPPSHLAITPLCVKLGHVAKVISDAYSSPTLTPSTSTPHTLPLQQKLVVATLLLLVRGKSVKEVTLGRLRDAYTRVCCQRQLRQDGEAEFVSVCQVLDDRGLLGMKRGKETRMSKVSLKLQESEVEKALQDQPLLLSVLCRRDITS